ncbi:MAG TPA: alpha-glucan family phosphorylase [Acidimicrobiia bacterium]|nr:alpha-glucan family phosphorylase [Acidimicrobiia bacterium]
MIKVPVLTSDELRIPARFALLYELAYNLWWTWDPVALDLWRTVDPTLWNQYHNPIDMLRALDPDTWSALDESETFHDLYTEATRRFDEYLADQDTWWTREHEGELPEGPIAYLCAEYGIHASLPIYSGGLGVLAGDHAKAASDLGIPFIGTGLLYRRGYFSQEIDVTGDQQHMHPHLDIHQLPVRPVAGPTGGQLKVAVDFPGRQISAAVWLLQVGVIPLLLLDSDIPENDPADRPITHTLYVRGREMRFCQEMILGIGSVKALAAIGVEPAVWHVNEGHAALSILERLKDAVAGGSALEDAEEQIRARTAFTLHTPVPAGNEVFDFSIIERYLGYWPGLVGCDLGYLAHLGATEEGAGNNDRFDMGAMAIRMSSRVNGVSRRHADVVNKDWSHLLKAPALGVTNGIHTPGWISRDLDRLLTRHIGVNWRYKLVNDPSVFEAIRDIDDSEIWAAHVSQKRLLTRFARGRIRVQHARHGASPLELRSVETMFPSDRLTIGFARRFAGYKRATLMFHNKPWLQAILTNPDRPVQIVFAGKAHPADQWGSGLIQQIHELGNSPEFKGHLYVLEDYNLRMARFLVQGVDVWLNNPRPPEEASGTSGMKAALNGALNVSTPDGWWIEGYNQSNGWTFGTEYGNGDHAAQDNEDAVALYHTLQDQVVPTFFDRDEAGVPHAWVAMMKESIISVINDFSTARMVADYTEKIYLPLAEQVTGSR